MKILHEFSHLFNYGTPACRALFVTRNKDKVSPLKKLLASDTRIFLDLGNLVELLHFGGIIHVEDFAPISNDLESRKESTIHYNSLIVFFTESVSGSEGKFVPNSLSLAISQGIYDGNLTLYQTEIDSSENIYCAVPRIDARGCEIALTTSYKSSSSSQAIISGTNKFRELEQATTNPEARAYFKEQADWYASLTIEEKMQYHNKRFST